MSDLGFDPAKVSYVYRYTKNSRLRKDGSKQNSSPKGPYWYAHWIEGGSLKAKYLGRELPDECKPYAPPEVLPDLTVKRRGRVRKARRGASDTILEALDNGDQVVIDLNQIAKDCNAYVDKIGERRYVIYRDPKETDDKGRI